MPFARNAGSKLPRLPIFKFNAAGVRPIILAYSFIKGCLALLFLNGILQYTFKATMVCSLVQLLGMSKYSNGYLLIIFLESYRRARLSLGIAQLVEGIVDGLYLNGNL